MTAVVSVGVRSKRGVGVNADAGLGVLLVTPILITMAALVFYPVARTFWDSLHRVNPMQAEHSICRPAKLHAHVV